MVPIEQKDWTEEDRASKLGQNHPLDSTKRQNVLGGVRHSFYSSREESHSPRSELHGLVVHHKAMNRTATRKAALRGAPDCS